MTRMLAASKPFSANSVKAAFRMTRRVLTARCCSARFCGRPRAPGRGTAASCRTAFLFISPPYHARPGALRIMPKHVPQKACPGLDPGWIPVLRKWTCANKELEQGDDSKKSHPALAKRLEAEVIDDPV